MEQIAIIDLGSNSIRFVIIQISVKGSYKLIYQEKESIRLSDGMFENNMCLTEEAQQRALKSLMVYSHIIKSHNITKVLAVATAAVRNAKNGSSFIKRVRASTGIPMTVISGFTEATLGFSGVIHTIDQKDFLLFDLGGASVEISLVKNKKRVNSISIPIGAVTLTEKFHSENKISVSLKEEMELFIANQLNRIDWLPKKSIPIIGIGGTVRNLAKIHQRKKQYPLPKLHNYHIPTKDLYRIITNLTKTTTEERKHISGLSNERNDIIIAGTLVIQELLKAVKPEELIISGCGLREGIFFRYYDKKYDNKKEYLKNMLISSVKNYKASIPLHDNKHVTLVTKIALTMFDQWKSLHNLPNRFRKLLFTASFLHDTGILINYYSHARHSAYLTANAHIFGLSHKEQIMCAFIIAFHHGYSRKFTRNNPYLSLLSDEDIKQIKILACFLQLAECLDESNSQLVNKVVCSSSHNMALIRVYITENHFDMFAHAVNDIAPYFEKLFDIKLVFEWYPSNRAKR